MDLIPDCESLPNRCRQSVKHGAIHLDRDQLACPGDKNLQFGNFLTRGRRLEDSDFAAERFQRVPRYVEPRQIWIDLANLARLKWSLRRGKRA